MIHPAVARVIRDLICVGTLGLALVGLGAGSSWGQGSLPELQAQAAEGNRAYESGDFDAAVTAYEAAVAAGLDDAALHYNLGNAYYKRGEVGHAIASFRRALKRSPRDRSIRTNLEQARSHVRDADLVPLELPVFLRPLQWVYSRLSLDEWTAVGLLMFVLTLGLLTAGHWTTAASRLRRRAAMVTAVLAVLGFLSAGIHYTREQGQTRAIVVAEEVEVRSGPGVSYNLTFKIHEGLEVLVSDRREDWAQIDLGGELVGWVSWSEIEVL